MCAIHDHATRQTRNRLKTAAMGLGLVRLLQDAGRAEEAKSTLSLLENEFRGVVKESDADLRQSPKDRACVAGVSLLAPLMLAASAVLLSVVGVTSANEKRPELAQMEVDGIFAKFDADKNEITIKVNGKNEMTFRLSQDAKVTVGEVKDLTKLKIEDSVTLTLMKDGDKIMVIEVRQGRQKGSFSPSPSQI
jgi:hypothetical protein